MKKIFGNLFLLAIILNQVYADGPPIKNGNISIPYLSITLTDDQVKQVGIFRYFELNKAQKDLMNEKTESEVPSIIRVITAPYNDCACGLGFYGLWANKYEVQVPLRYLKYDLVYGPFEELEVKINVEPTMDDIREKMSPRVLNMDIYGDIHQKGVVVNNLQNALDQIILDKPEFGNSKYVFVNTPPLKNNDVIEIVGRSFLNLKSYLQKNGYSLFAFFENEYIVNKENGYDKLPTFQGVVSKPNLARTVNGCGIKCGSKWEIEASSTGRWKNYIYHVDYLKDTLMTTSWVENVPGHGLSETITFKKFIGPSDQPININGFIIANGFQKTKELFLKNSRIKTIVLEKNDKALYVLKINDKMGYQKIIFPTLSLNNDDEIRLKIVDIYGGVKYQDTSLTMLIPIYDSGT